MNEYLLFLRGGDGRIEDMTEEQRNEHMQRWGAYMGKLSETGNLVGGQPLQREGIVLSSNGADKGVVESKAGEAIGGWLHFKANDYDHAVELAKDCPIFEHDGNIEIREIMEM
ncbi:MAG: YciI family protein [Flavobacteriales bacterium]|nr:YciI family protein [Flavobacteriales bacterium]